MHIYLYTIALQMMSRQSLTMKSERQVLTNSFFLFIISSTAPGHSKKSIPCIRFFDNLVTKAFPNNKLLERRGSKNKSHNSGTQLCYCHGVLPLHGKPTLKHSSSIDIHCICLCPVVFTDQKYEFLTLSLCVRPAPSTKHCSPGSIPVFLLKVETRTVPPTI